MRIQVLGSAAAEGWPAMFCECAACAEARRRGGPDIRRRTAYAVNGAVLVDYGPDIYWQATEFGIDLTQVTDIVFTHSHSDHLDPVELTWRRKGYSVVTRSLRVHGNAHVQRRLESEPLPALDRLGIEFGLLQSGMTFAAGDLRISALKANHSTPDEDALNFVIEQQGVTALIGNDTGWWDEPTWQVVQGFKLDIAILECTYGLKTPDQVSHHLGAAATVAMRDRLRELGALKPDALVVANHFSHNGLGLHQELTDYFRPHGIEVAFDGLVLERG